MKINKREKYNLNLTEIFKNRLLLRDKTPLYIQQNDDKNVLYHKDFYCWDTEFLGHRDCCFNHIIGLPVNEKTKKVQPLFDYEDELYDVWERNRLIWIKKATGLGISEFFFRLIACIGYFYCNWANFPVTVSILSYIGCL